MPKPIVTVSPTNKTYYNTSKNMEADTQRWLNVARGNNYTLSAVVRDILGNQGLKLVSELDPDNKKKNMTLLEAVGMVIWESAILDKNLTACNMLLDRIGGKPRQEVEISAVTSHEEAIKELAAFVDD